MTITWWPAHFVPGGRHASPLHMRWLYWEWREWACPESIWLKRWIEMWVSPPEVRIAPFKIMICHRKLGIWHEFRRIQHLDLGSDQSRLGISPIKSHISQIMSFSWGAKSRFSCVDWSNSCTVFFAWKDCWGPKSCSDPAIHQLLATSLQSAPTHDFFPFHVLTGLNKTIPDNLKWYPLVI